MRRIPLWFLAVAVGTASVSSPVVAQDEEQKPQFNLQQLPQVDLKGTVENVKADGITIKCEGQTFFVTIDPNYARVVCNGTAERSFLKPGVMVRFSGEFDKKLQAKGTVDELAVVTPSEMAVPGIHADEPEDEEKPRGKSRSSTGIYVVVGTIKLLKDDQLQVVAEGKPVKVQLGEELDLKVEIDDYTWAMVGDEVEVKGRRIPLPPGQGIGQIYAEEVTIALAKPLEASSKVQVKKKKPARPVKRS